MRLIDADALKEDLRMGKECDIDCPTDWKACHYDRIYAKQDFCEWIDDAPTIEPEPHWIPWDSGTFPEESGTYTVTAYDGATKRVTYAKYQKRLKRWELTGARAYWRVLAWMPLPEAYREGES